MMIDNETRQAQQLSAALAKLLRLTYEMGRDEALAGESCSRDFAKDADKFTTNRRNLTESEWAICQECLPKPFEYVLVSTKQCGRTIAHYMPNTFKWFDLHSENVEDVIAWQPLPSAYI